MKGQSAFFKAVCALAVPAALQSMLQSSFSMVDQIMIGQLGVSRRSSGGGAGWTGWAARNKLSKKTKKIRPPNGDRIVLARRKGFEPLTFWSVARHSIQLS